MTYQLVFIRGGERNGKYLIKEFKPTRGGGHWATVAEYDNRKEAEEAFSQLADTMEQESIIKSV